MKSLFRFNALVRHAAGLPAGPVNCARMVEESTTISQALDEIDHGRRLAILAGPLERVSGVNGALENCDSGLGSSRQQLEVTRQGNLNGSHNKENNNNKPKYLSQVG